MVRLAIVTAIATAWIASSAIAQERTRRANRPGCEATPSVERILSVTERGDLSLASGRIVKLSGIRLGNEPGERSRAVEWLREAAGGEVQMAAFGTSVDRWGRNAAIVVVNREAGAIDLARALVDSGLALVDAGEADALCRTDLLGVEQQARQAGLGLWRGDRYTPVAAEDLERLKERIGRFALVEGRVRSVGERGRRTYLNFGPEWASDFTVTIPQRTWDTMRHRGRSAEGLRGRRIRVRGVIEEWQGPAMTLASADLLEVLDNAPPPRR